MSSIDFYSILGWLFGAGRKTAGHLVRIEFPSAYAFASFQKKSARLNIEWTSGSEGHGVVLQDPNFVAYLTSPWTDTLFGHHPDAYRKAIWAYVQSCGSIQQVTTDDSSTLQCVVPFDQEGLPRDVARARMRYFLDKLETASMAYDCRAADLRVVLKGSHALSFCGGIMPRAVFRDWLMPLLEPSRMQLADQMNGLRL